MNIFGKKLKLAISADGNSNIVTVLLDGLPAGTKADLDKINERMTEPLPGLSELGIDKRSTEPPAIVSGIENGRLTGAPLVALIKCTAENPSANPDVLVPGTDDLASYLGNCGSTGAYSGRRDAALLFAGAVAEELLTNYGISLMSEIMQIGEAKYDSTADSPDMEMKKALLDARGGGDSVGCTIVCRAKGVPAGLGSPAFYGLESAISALLFSLPGVKGVQFGAGFGFAAMKGSTANDSIVLKDDIIKAETNMSGGIDCGISNGEEIVLSCALRPTPHITRQQNTVNTKTMQSEELRLRGRTEACLGPRALQLVKSAVALCIADAVLIKNLKAEGETDGNS